MSLFPKCQAALLCGVCNGGEVYCLKGSSPDQAAINICLPKQFNCVIRLDASAILNPHIVSYHISERSPQSTPEEAMHLLCLFRGSSPTRANRPYGFVGNGDRLELFDGKSVQASTELPKHDILDSSCFAFFKGLSDADNGSKSRRQSRDSPTIYALIGLTKQLATLRMA
jgi:hypothetical protein